MRKNENEGISFKVDLMFLLMEIKKWHIVSSTPGVFHSIK